MKQKPSHEASDQQPGRCLEIISIRLYDPADRRNITELFLRMARRYPDARFTLFRNAAIEGDWSIHMWRPPAAHEGAKSPEALCLFELLRKSASCIMVSGCSNPTPIKSIKEGIQMNATRWTQNKGFTGSSTLCMLSGLAMLILCSARGAYAAPPKAGPAQMPPPVVSVAVIAEENRQPARNLRGPG